MSFVPEKTLRAHTMKADTTPRPHTGRYHGPVRTTRWTKEQMAAHLEGLKTPAMKQNEQRVTPLMLRRMAKDGLKAHELADHYGVSVGFVQEQLKGAGRK